MDLYLDLWIEHPVMASIIMDILLLLAGVGILICVILVRWQKASKEQDNKDKALDQVMWDFVHEPIQNLKEFKNNIKKDFKK